MAGMSGLALAEGSVDAEVPDDVGSTARAVTVVRGARTPRRIDRLASGLPVDERRAAGLQVVRAAGLAGVVRPASEHVPEVVGAQRMLPVLPELRAALPGGGLRRGATVAVGSSSVLLALLAGASRAGSWCGVVGLPTLNLVAAAEMGIALDRLALVPHPGTEWTTVVAALLDGLDIVVAAPPGPVAPVVAKRFAARARQRGSVFVPVVSRHLGRIGQAAFVGAWPGADLVVEEAHGVWEGLGQGRGRLRRRQMTIQVHGRGAASALRETTIWLPGPGAPDDKVVPFRRSLAAEPLAEVG